MFELAALQDAFARTLRRELPDQELAAQLAGDAAHNVFLLGLYRSNACANACAALRLAYPVGEALLGEDSFQTLGQLYWQTTPPDGGDLNRYGAQFAAFAQQQDAFANLPWLHDVLALEWLLHLAAMTEDHEALPIRSLAGLSAEALGTSRLYLQPAAQLLDSAWAAGSIWLAHHGGTALEQIDSQQAEQILVCRVGLKPWVFLPGPGEAGFVSALQQGCSCGQAIATALAADESFDPAASMARLFERGLVVGIGSGGLS